MTHAAGRLWLTTAALGAIAAGLYALSPLTMVCVPIMWWGVGRAIADLEGGERRWVGGALAIGLGLRVLSVLAVFLATRPSVQQFNVLFGDGRFAVDRSIWILNDRSGVPISPYYWVRVFENYGDTWYHYSLAVIQWFLGPAPYALSLISVACFEAFAIGFHRLMRAAFGATSAVAALIAVLFWPTIFVWSFSMLKESMQFVLAISAIAGTVWCLRQRGLQARIGWLSAVAIALLVLTKMRPGSFAMAAGAIAFGLIVRAATRRAWMTAALVATAVLVTYSVATRPSVQARALAETRLALSRHLGHVRSSGFSYRAADQRFYMEDNEAPWSMTRMEGERFLLRSAAAFFLAPLPSHIGSVAGWLFVPLNLAWYTLLVLAAAGVPAALRRDTLVTALCAGYLVAGLIVIAPNSGNIGTLIRHRDMVVPFVIGLSSVGLVSLLSTIAADGPRTASMAATRSGEGDVFNAAR
jgi:hypothetical protein